MRFRGETENVKGAVMEGRPTSERTLRMLIKDTEMKGKASDLRTVFATLAGPQPEMRRVDRGGIECGIFGDGPEVIWFHGGGYVFGAPDTHAVLASKLAEHGVTVILPAYRRAPEHIWPAMLEDALAVIDASSPAILAGDSVGGHLALNAALNRPAKGLALVAPNTDRTGRSRTRNREGDLMNDNGSDDRFRRMATPYLEPDDPEASPLLADLSGLPPVHLEVAGAEMLLDDTLLFARQAALAGVKTSLRVTPALFHMFPLWPDAIAEGAAALKRIAIFAHEHS